MDTKRLHIIFPAQIARELDLMLDRRKKTQFIIAATKERLDKMKLTRAIEKATGAWRDEDHPDMTGKDGTKKWVRNQRIQDEERRKSIFGEIPS